MIQAPVYFKKFFSAKKRFLEGAIDNFFQRELPKLLGPTLRKKLIEELVKIIEVNLPKKDYLRPGQMVWNAVDASTRADSPKLRLVPVILTLINEEDIENLSKGVPMSKIREEAIARMICESHQQGALLSMRDIGLFSYRDNSCISKYRINYEKKYNITLPHTGSIQDMGRCVSHKKIIIKKIIMDKKDPFVVAKETKHSMIAVDRYLKDFRRVEHCFINGKDIHFTSTATGLNKFVIKQYWEILQNLENNS